MKILVATEKPFAKVAVDGIRSVVEAAGFELALLEKYTEKISFILKMFLYICSSKNVCLYLSFSQTQNRIKLSYI